MRKRIIKGSSALMAAAMLLSAGCSRSDAPAPGATEPSSKGNVIISTVAEPETKALTEPETKAVTEPVTQPVTEPVTEEPKYEDPAKELTAGILAKNDGKALRGWELDKKMLSGLKKFSVDVFKDCYKAADPAENVLISPESIILALGMTANGAEGKTLSEMLKTITGMEDIDLLNKTLYYYAHPSKPYGVEKDQLKIADSVWIDTSKIAVSPYEDFLNTVRSIYDAQVYGGILSECTDQVNAWVKEHTDDMIEKIVDDISEDVRTILINAVCFDAKWKVAYEDDQVDENGTFTKEDGTEQKAAMLSSTENTYLHDDDTTGFIKYYEGNKYAFMALLPNEGINLSDYISGLTGEKISSLNEKAKRGENIVVSAKIPEFEYDYGTSLVDTLKNLGINEAFDDYSSEITKILKENDDPMHLFISDVIHKTHIELSREGTKAAAVTDVSFEEWSQAEPLETEYYTVYLDRPFVYAILDTESGLPVFMGTVAGV